MFLLNGGGGFKISSNGKESYFTNHLNLQNLQVTQRFDYPQIPLNKECYIKLTVRSNVYFAKPFAGVITIITNYSLFTLWSYNHVFSNFSLPGKDVVVYKNEFFHTPASTVGLQGIKYVGIRDNINSPQPKNFMYNKTTSYFSCDFEVFYN